MGWSMGHDSRFGKRGRDIGYGVMAFCDHPGCGKEIDRGLSHVCCDQEPHGGERGCGLYFCEAHHSGSTNEHHGLCARCYPRVRKPFEPTFDHPRWVLHKLTDESWQEWRDGHPEEVAEMRERISDTLTEHETKTLT